MSQEVGVLSISSQYNNMYLTTLICVIQSLIPCHAMPVFGGERA